MRTRRSVEMQMPREPAWNWRGSGGVRNVKGGESIVDFRQRSE